MGDFALRLEARVKNDALVRAREQLGLSIIAVAEEMGISHQTYGVVERLQHYPKPEIQAKIIEFYRSHGIKLSPEQVFPDQLKSLKPQKKYVVFRAVPLEELTQRDVTLLPTDNTILEVDEKIQREDLNAAIEYALSTLRVRNADRHAEVIRMRFGLGQYERTHTLDEVAAVYKVTRERIRQMSAQSYQQKNTIL
jgi:transcriptional regulator with XRE-family HTH domain